MSIMMLTSTRTATIPIATALLHDFSSTDSDETVKQLHQPVLGATERRPVGASPPATSVGQEARELREMVRQPEMRYDDCAVMHSKMPKHRSGGGTTTGTTVAWVGSSVGTIRIGQYAKSAGFLDLSIMPA
nr:hypothetical protein Itr_chr03CG00780 [Ipomoea trifida]